MDWIEYKKEDVIDYLPHVKQIIEEEKLDKPNRRRDIVHQRFFLMWYLRENTSMTLTEIGKLFLKDHSTVIHAVDYHFNSIDINDSLYFKNVERIKMYLEAIENEFHST